MSNNERLVARRHAVVPRAVGQFARETTIASASGARITDADGVTMIDFAGGIGVMNVGHCDERVVRAIQEQAARLIHTCIHVATYEPYVALCEKSVSLLPHGGPTKAVLLNSGAEAVENAVKFARQATGRTAVICFTEAFHGRTMMCMTLTSKTRYKVGCGPFAPEVYRLPYPNHFRDGEGLSLDDFVSRELARLEEAFVNIVSADHVAAIIIEPVLGEGGFIPAPANYLRGLRKVCDRQGIMLIFDEVQSGFGRTGRWAAYEHAGVVPDLSTWAKSMGGGKADLGRARQGEGDGRGRAGDRRRYLRGQSRGVRRGSGRDRNHGGARPQRARGSDRRSDQGAVRETQEALRSGRRRAWPGARWLDSSFATTEIPLTRRDVTP